MATLSKIKSGVLLYEDFKGNSMLWTPSPNNYEEIDFTESGLKILHSDTYKTFTIQEPNDNYCFVCKINHIPMSKKDIGGVIIMSNDTSYIECQSYVAEKHSYVTNSITEQEKIVSYIEELLDEYVSYSIVDDSGIVGGTGATNSSSNTTNGNTNTSNNTSNNAQNNQTFNDVLYPYIKVIKENLVYTFLASTDGKRWIEVGNTKIYDTNRIGFFVQSFFDDSLTKDEIIDKSNFYVENMMFYSNNYVIINHIPDDYIIELRDENGTFMLDSRNNDYIKIVNNIAYINTNIIKVPNENVRIVFLKNINNQDVIQREYIIPMFTGGDEYNFSYEIELYLNQNLIEQETIFNLDAFYSHDQEIRIDIQNKEDIEINNIKVSIETWSTYYGGSESILVALYDENPVYDTSVIIDSILPSEGKSILLKLADTSIQNFYKKEGEFRFKINIE